METAVKPELIRGEHYWTRKYPDKTIINSKYLGEVGEKHIFDADTDYLFFDKDEIVVETRVITYSSYSSHAVEQFPKSALSLVNILKELGELENG